MADPPLAFSASLAQKANQPARLDGGCGARALRLLSYAPDEDHPTATVSIDEVHPNGSTSTLISRRRVDRPEAAAAHNELARLHPRGQGDALYARMHWPALPDCVLTADHIRVGQPLPLFNLPLRVEGAADERTRAWLEQRQLPGGEAVVPPAPPPAVPSPPDADGTAEEELPFYLGGPRPQRDAVERRLAEDDPASSLSLHRARAAAWPSLRGQPASKGVASGGKSGALLLPSELSRLDKAMRYGQNTRLVFLARAGGSGAALPDGPASAAQLAEILGPRLLLLSFYVSDEALQITEIHPCGAATGFGRRQGSGSHETTTLLKRCRAPKTATKPSPRGGGSSFVELEDIYCGSALKVAGTLLRITCCEPSTRRRLTDGGLAAELGLPERVPLSTDAPAAAAAGLEAESWPGRDEEEWPSL